MPIKPENKGRYPADWQQVRERILARAGNCCEKCKAPNRHVIARGGDKDLGTYQNMDAYVFDADTGEALGQYRMSDYTVDRMVEIVLTIAHLDHMPENCADENLLALCQRCHLKLDQAHHQANAKATRHARKAAGDLFEGLAP